MSRIQTRNTAMSASLSEPAAPLAELGASTGE